MRRTGTALMFTAALAGSALLAAGCGNGDGTSSGSATASSKLTGTVKVDGSSTVAPLSEAVAEAFQGDNPKVRVTVGTSGTGGGFEKFCAGEIDVADASRAIEDEEIAGCAKGKVEYDQFQVANDGLAIVVNPKADWANCLTTAQLKKIWDTDSKVDNWKDVDPDFPDQELELFGPGTDSGTFDYFTKAINGEEGRSRSDYNATEDDNVTVQGVAGSEGGIGYFGLSYAEQNEDKLKTVQVDSGSGCVTPTTKTVQSGEYTPLSRPLYVYPSKALLARPEGAAFVNYYAEHAQELAKQALFVPLTDDQQSELAGMIDQLTS